MPTILNAGSTHLSNADVLQWVRAKRDQHSREDAEDVAAGRPKAQRPAKFMNSLRKHERELLDNKHPYALNPGAYEGSNRHKSIKIFLERFDEEVCDPLYEKSAGKNMSFKELKTTFSKINGRKTFTTLELMMIQNLAPENVSMLEMVLEGWESRFSVEEMEKIVQIIDEVYRCGDKLPAAQTEAKVP